MVKSIKLRYIGRKRKQPLNIIPLDKDNAPEFTRLYNIITDDDFLLEDTIGLLKESHGYIIYDNVSIGIILIKGHKIKLAGVLPEYKNKGYEKKALYKAIELIKDNISIKVDSKDENISLYLRHGFMIEKEYNN